jgi:anti-sigma factor RsiW
MMRQTIDEYLDGMLDAQGKAAVEQALARDPEAAAMARTLREERALRAAVYESYQPSRLEASALAAQILAACHEEAEAPVGRVGFPSWVRMVSGIAAAVAIAIAAFGVGRVTAPVTAGTEKTTVALYIKDGEGPPKLYTRLASYDDVESVLRELEAPLDTQFADAGDIALPGRI